MPDKIVVNGTEYDSPDAMPPDVRREYERALQLIKDLGQGAGAVDSTEKTVRKLPGGVEVKVHTHRVQYTVDGKTYDDREKLPPEVRARVAQALERGVPLDVRNLPSRDVSVMHVHTETRRSARVGRLAFWMLLGAAAALVMWSVWVR